MAVAINMTNIEQLLIEARDRFADEFLSINGTDLLPERGTLTAFKYGWNANAEIILELWTALEKAKGQLQHAGYTKNAVPAIDESLARVEAKLKERV
jgi:hypothetical protein